MKIVTAAEMREIDRRTVEEFDVPSLTLMENAGSAVAEFCREQYPEAQRIGIVCGKGNNGGDGFVAARRLHEVGREVRVLLLADPAEVKGDAAAMLQRLPFPPVVARTDDELKSEAAQAIFAADLLVDAILGTGFQPPVTGIYASAIELLQDAVPPIVAVDLPSGLDADSGSAAGPVVFASQVVTFTALKPALALLAVPVVVVEIGSPAEAMRSALNLNLATPGREYTSASFSGVDDVVMVAPRDAESNKGDYGHVLVVGGARGKAGAAALAGMAALRVGAGLCTVATAQGVQNVVAGFAPELMTENLAETEAGTISLRALEYGRIDALAEGKTVIALGPGISRHPESAEFVRTLVHRRRVPVVLDADGLNAFDDRAERLDGSGVPLVLTPHPGEMARLAGVSVADVQADRVGAARKFAQDQNCLVVLKGHRTVIATPGGEVWLNPTGNPGMASGGTGDVLTGMIAGMIAGWARVPADAMDEADLDRVRNRLLVYRIITAVYLHGLAGDLAADEVGEHGMTASDLLRFIPAAICRLPAIRGEKWRWVSRRPARPNC